MRQIVLDTETTGLDPAKGHKIIELGCVELLDRKLTGRHLHLYINPQREVEAGALEVHGISNEFLADKPVFGAVADSFIEFVEGAELVIHNAPFDIGFLNHELATLGRNYKSMSEYCAVLDTLALARKKHPGQKNNLDALCKRYEVDNSQRELHGALKDAEILADVYLLMTGGQSSLGLGYDEGFGQGSPQEGRAGENLADFLGNHDRPKMKVIRATEAELLAHQDCLATIARDYGGKLPWQEVSDPTS
jgi:DNA polymerase III subunit epsilon